MSNPTVPPAVGNDPASDGKRKKDAWDVAQIAVSSVTALMVLTLNWQAGNITRAFDQSTANAQMVQAFVADLVDPEKSDFAIIALYHHAHDTNNPETKQLVVDLAHAVLTSKSANNFAISSEANSFALNTVIRNDDPTNYQAARDRVFKAAPRPSGSPVVKIAPIKLTKAGKEQQLAVLAVTGASATVYIQYTTKGVRSDAKRSQLLARAQGLAQALRSSGKYSVPDVEPVDVLLTKTSVRYYYDEDAPAAKALSAEVKAGLGLHEIGAPHFNGPADVTRGQLEIWMAETT